MLVWGAQLNHEINGWGEYDVIDILSQYYDYCQIALYEYHQIRLLISLKDNTTNYIS